MKNNKLGVYVSTTEGKRPFGLVLAVIYTLIAGSLSVIAGVLGIAVSELVDAIFLPVGVLFLAAAYGLWTTQKWGLTLARGVYLVSIVLGIASLSTTGISTSTDLLSAGEVALDILVTIYLFRPQTKILFR